MFTYLYKNIAEIIVMNVNIFNDNTLNFLEQIIIY